MGTDTRQSFGQGYMDGRNACISGANDGSCRWVGGRCAVDGEMVAKGGDHFNPPYAYGYQAGWEDTERRPERMSDPNYVGYAMDTAYSEHKLWEVF